MVYHPLRDPGRGNAATKFRVIGAGMSRTGTTSLGNALQILLGPVHDSGTYLSRGTKEQQMQWLEAVSLALPKHDAAAHPSISLADDKDKSTNQQDDFAVKPLRSAADYARANNRSLAETKRLESLLASLLDGYSATTDVPACLLTPELLALFPDALVIATTRDAAAWHRSQALIDALSAWWARAPWLLRWLPKLAVLPAWTALRARLLAARLGKPRLSEPADLARHEAWLRAVVPPDRLFFVRVADGWPPLCAVLGLPVPDVPFPRSNDAHTVRRDFAVVVAAGLLSWAVVLGAAGAAGWAAWWLCRSVSVQVTWR